MIAAVAFPAVVNASEVTVGVVVIPALKQVFVPLADALCMQAALFSVLVFA